MNGKHKEQGTERWMRNRYKWMGKQKSMNVKMGTTDDKQRENAFPRKEMKRNF